MGYRPRITATKRLEDGLYLSQSIYPRIPRPKAKGLLLSFLGGALAFIVIGLILLAIAG